MFVIRYHEYVFVFFFFFSSRRRHTRCSRDWSSDVCSSDLQFWAYCGLALETRSSADYRFEDGQLVRAKKPVFIRGLNRNHNHDLKNLFKSAATTASAIHGPFREFYEGLLARIVNLRRNSPASQRI